MALEAGRPVKFRVVLRLVPGLFYVKCLEIKNVPRVLRLFARTHVRVQAPSIFSICAYIEPGTRRTRGTKNVFNRLECSMSSEDVEQAWNKVWTARLFCCYG
jgi:hypothetical protein